MNRQTDKREGLERAVMEESNRDRQTQEKVQFFEGGCRWMSQKI